jgi:hypothetical protein
LICGWLWEQNRFGSSPKIDRNNIDALLSLPPVPFIERAKRLLIHFAEQSDRLGKTVDLGSPRLDAMAATGDCQHGSCRNRRSGDS